MVNRVRKIRKADFFEILSWVSQKSWGIFELSFTPFAQKKPVVPVPYMHDFVAFFRSFRGSFLARYPVLSRLLFYLCNTLHEIYFIYFLCMHSIGS